MTSPAVKQLSLISHRRNAFALVGLRGRSSAFTLVEMLVVIVIISILLVGVIPAFNSINGSRGVTRAVNDIAGILELARVEAMATRSYAYVGFVNTTNSDGNADLRCAALISIDGSSDSTAANLRPISKLVKLPNVLMTNYTRPQDRSLVFPQL